MRPRRHLGAAILVAALACGGSRPESARTEPHAATPVVASDPAPTGRLGDAVVPRRAVLDLEIDPRQPRFRGRIAIDVELVRPVNAIWLHARGLELGRARLSVGARELPLRWLTSPADDRDLVGLGVGRTVGPGRAVLTIDYAGKLGTRNGLFRQNVDSTWYAFTDFEAIDARMAMPCFDDPRFKIPWQVNLRVPDGMRGFANAPERSATPVRGGRRIEFAETPPLPTYLVAFAVGPFDVLEAGATPVPIRVIATRHLAGLGADALALAPGMLADLERYLAMKTPFPKIDLLAVPIFNGAMENPGLITFSASILLLEPNVRDTAAGRTRYHFMAGVLAHELAHLWFGDLVTMEWWDELWLNEGLATWMSDRLLAVAVPGQGGQVVDVVDKAPGLDMDRGQGGPPGIAVRRPIEKPPDIGDQFSPLTYRKGGAIAAMFDAYLGEERMRAGLRRYVADHAGGTVTSEDLARSLSAAAGADVGPALKSFLDQPGVPLVEAKLSCGRGRPTVSLRQSAYSPLGRSPPLTRWQVPVCVAWEGGEAPACTLLAEERGAIELPAQRCPAWIHPNPGERGYYFYGLPPAQLRALAQVSRLSAREQAGLADDIDALLVAGRVPLDAALDATFALARRPDSLTAARAGQTLTMVARTLVGDRQRRAFAARLRAALGPVAHRLGLSPHKGESPTDSLLRQIVVPLVARHAGDRTIQAQASRRLMEILDGTRKGPGKPSQEELVLLYNVAPLAGDAALFDRLVSNGGEHAGALGEFRRPDLVARALAAVTDGKLEPRQAMDVLIRLLRDGDTVDAALPVALAEYPALVARLASTDRAFAAGLFAGACRIAARTDVEDVLRRVFAPGGSELPAEARSSLERIASCAAFRDIYQAPAQKYFR